MVAIPDYRPVVRATKGDYSATALVGTHSVSVAWNCRDGRQNGLRGFTVRKTEYNASTGDLVATNWLRGEKRFRNDIADGVEISSARAPFQRFRWSDYTLKANQAYRFEVFPVRGSFPALTMDEPPVGLMLRPSQDIVDGVGIHVNRGVTSAFAYLDRFKLQHPSDVADGSAYRWLSRGLKEALLGFIAAAKLGEALHVCIYEFFEEEIAEALRAARGRGVVVDIVYHAKAGDHATTESEHLLHAKGLDQVATARRKVGNISHNKFIVHLVGGQPVRLFTGTANFSQNAFYFQTNAAVTLEDPVVAATYEDYFRVLKDDPARTGPASNVHEIRNRVRAILERINIVSPRRFESTYFSPLRKLDIVDKAIDMIGRARSCVFVSSPFGLDGRIVEALGRNSEDILEYGLANTTARKKIESLNRKNTRFFTPSRLETYLGRAWDSKAFGAHKIHTKLIAIDPWSDSPQLLFGSANFSEDSCTNNDENAFLSNDPRMNAVMVTEFLRMFDHYKSRAFINQIRSTGLSDDEFLKEDDSWSRTSFNPASNSHKFRDRVAFMGG
ncbi:phospholipase D-like domain-containing protein [Sphingosinicella sp.]|uniref:phospholipase D-like domain-containing protein n=1 Tax=Sphingosinicella sp. TaxID=1917971 RepID=UPI004038407F